MRNSKKKSRLKVCVVATIGAAVISIIMALLYINNNNQSVDIQKGSFSETYDINFVLSESASDNINELLAGQRIEDESYYGFSNNKNVKVDLYQVYSIVKLITLIEGYDLDSVQQKLSFLSDANFEQFDFLNLMYYIDLCEKLNVELDYTALNKVLVNYYDKEHELFYLDDEKDSINIKLIATAMVKNILKEKLSAELFCPESGIEKAYKEYSFITQSDVTLYNSGGDIIYCISVYDMDNIIDRMGLENWYRYWKELYEGEEITSLVSAVQYAEYLKVAKVFEPNYSETKLQEYYESLTSNVIDEYEEPNILYNFMKNVNIEKNKAVADTLKNKVENMINTGKIVDLDIDVKATVYGVMLAKKSGFKINEEKINHYIKDNYENCYKIEQIYDRTSNLYYNLILDQLINGYEQNYDSEYFQQQVDDILAVIDYDSELFAGEIISTRRVVEIVSDLQLFDVDIKLTNAQKKKIREGLEKALEINEINTSFLINDIYTVDKILSLGMLSDEKVIEIYNELTIDGGTCAAKGEEIIPDVNSTYQFFVTLSRMNNFGYLDEQQRYISELKIRDGIFAFDSKNKYSELSAIVYANAVYNAKIGGDKFD